MIREFVFKDFVIIEFIKCDFPPHYHSSYYILFPYASYSLLYPNSPVPLDKIRGGICMFSSHYLFPTPHKRPTLHFLHSLFHTQLPILYASVYSWLKEKGWKEEESEKKLVEVIKRYADLLFRRLYGN